MVKIIAVGNEAMVTWQAHFVPAATILRWVKHPQGARSRGDIPAGTTITTSEIWAALGGEESYRNEDLAEFVARIDFLSLHTYAFHDTCYNPALQEYLASIGVEKAGYSRDSAGAAVPSRRLTAVWRRCCWKVSLDRYT